MSATRAAARVVCLSADEPGAALLASAVRSIIPPAAVDVADLRAMVRPPEADLFVVEGATDPPHALDLLRVLRARGGVAPAVLVAHPEQVPGGEAARRLGDFRVAPPERLAESLPNAIEEALALSARAAADPEFAALLAAVRASRQLAAAGEIALRVRHDLNNPLGALLAEAQLLELEEMPPAQREAVGRIIELCRRVIAVTRRLEGPAGGAHR